MSPEDAARYIINNETKFYGEFPILIYHLQEMEQFSGVETKLRQVNTLNV